MAAIAALPIVAVLIALALRSRGVIAAFVGWGLAIVIAAFFFPVGARQMGEAVSVFGPLAVEISLIVIGGVALAGAMERTGRQDRLARFMIAASNGRDRAVLLVAICVTCVAESVTGFGVSIVVTIPLLLVLGVRPAAALVMSLISLVTGPWGSLAPGTLVASQMTGLDFRGVGVWSAVYDVVVIAVAFPIVATLGIGKTSARRFTGELITVGAVMIGVLIGANLFPGPPLAGAFAGIAGAVVFSLFGRRAQRGDGTQSRFPARAFAPYLVLIGVILVGAAVEPVIGGAGGAIVGSPVLGLIAATATALAGASAESRQGMVSGTFRTAWPTVLTAIGFLGLGATMTATGMSTEMAEALATIGPAFVTLVPLLGVIAGYITSTTTGANALFASAVHASGAASGLPPMALVASFNVAASYASVVSPSRVALALAMIARSPAAATDAESSRATRMVLLIITLVGGLIGAVNGVVWLVHAAG